MRTRMLIAATALLVAIAAPAPARAATVGYVDDLNGLHVVFRAGHGERNDVIVTSSAPGTTGLPSHIWIVDRWTRLRVSRGLLGCRPLTSHRVECAGYDMTFHLGDGADRFLSRVRSRFMPLTVLAGPGKKHIVVGAERSTVICGTGNDYVELKTSMSPQDPDRPQPDDTASPNCRHVTRRHARLPARG